MKLLKTKEDMSALADSWHSEHLRVALVPTMGFLHEGHLSLIRIAHQKADRVIVSVFVNPTQFAPNEDFASYPRNEAADRELCKKEGVHAVFIPDAGEIYEPDASIGFTESSLSKVLCGKTRPTHFQGVLLVVNKLFNITRADAAVFGMKDAQQLAIIRRMVRDLDMPVEIVPAPIVREADGLAMSSRNVYLSTTERKDALCLRQALDMAEKAWADGSTSAESLISDIRKMISAVSGAAIDYVEAVDADTLEAVSTLRSNTLVAIAVKIGKTRLIDNIVLN
jgi:pantoate--beta-alanine ligase